MLTKNDVVTLYLNHKNQHNKLIRIPFSEIDPDAIKANCLSVFEWHAALFETFLNKKAYVDYNGKNLIIIKEISMNNKLSIVIEIPYSKRDNYLEAIYEFNNAVSRDGNIELFVNNNPYSLNSFLCIEDKMDSYEQIKELINKYALNIVKDKKPDDLFNDMCRARMYQHTQFIPDESLELIRLKMDGLYFFASQNQLLKKGYGCSQIKNKLVFVSYSHSDNKIVNEVVDKLKYHGANIWIDKEDIEYGEHIVNSFMKAVSECDFAIIFLSKHSSSSFYTKTEIQNLAVKIIENKTKWFLIKLDDVNVEEIFPNLNNYKYYDFSKDCDIDNLIDKILHSIKALDT